MPPFESALRRAAVWNLGFATLAVATALWVDSWPIGGPAIADMLITTLPFTAPLVILLVSIVWLVLLGSRQDETTSTPVAYAMWGRIAVIDAIALVPWSFGVLVDWTRRSPHDGWPFVNAAGLAGCVSVHVLLLPHLLRTAFTRSLRVPSEDAVPPSDWIRAGLGRIATRRFWAVCAGLIAFALPWGYSDCIAVMDGTPTLQRESMTGIRLVADEDHVASRLLAKIALVAILVLGCVSAWGWQRARWPLAPRLSQTRAFLAWALSLAACAPWLLLWFVVVVSFHRARPALVGMWLLTAALIGGALVTFAFAPLLLFLALRRRSEAERLQDLASKGGADEEPSLTPSNG